MDNVLHKIEPIVTKDRFEYGVHRMRVPGGWIYWLQPGGQVTSCFVPDVPESAPAPRAPVTAIDPSRVNAVQEDICVGKLDAVV